MQKPLNNVSQLKFLQHSFHSLYSYRNWPLLHVPDHFPFFFISLPSLLFSPHPFSSSKFRGKCYFLRCKNRSLKITELFQVRKGNNPMVSICVAHLRTNCTVSFLSHPLTGIGTGYLRRQLKINKWINKLAENFSFQCFVNQKRKTWNHTHTQKSISGFYGTTNIENSRQQQKKISFSHSMNESSKYCTQKSPPVKILGNQINKANLPLIFSKM